MTPGSRTHAATPSFYCNETLSTFFFSLSAKSCAEVLTENSFRRSVECAAVRVCVDVEVEVEGHLSPVNSIDGEVYDQGVHSGLRKGR